MKPPEVAQVHRNICASVACEYLDKIDYADPCSFCPNGHFGRYEQTNCPDLGDQLATFAQPIARGIDRVLGTDIANCRGCESQQTDLNAGVSFLDTVIKRMKGQYATKNTNNNPNQPS